MSFLKQKIDNDFIVAFKTKDNVTKSALSFLKSKIQEAEKKNKNNTELDDVSVMNVILSSIKQRKDSIQQFKSANRLDLVEKEQLELDAITKYLPEQMTDVEMRIRVAEIISSLSLDPVNKLKNIGVVTGVMQKQFKGQFEIEKLREVLNGLL